MLKNILALTICIAFWVNLAAFDGGTGTLQNPYQVSTLIDLRDMNNMLTSHFIQVCDINASGYSFDCNLFGHSGANKFYGSYNGNGYAIIGLNIYGNGNYSYTGFVGYCKDATLTNINLVNVNINISEGSHSGALAGYAENTVITNCSVSGNMQCARTYAFVYTGGLVAQANNCSISFCSSSVNIIADDSVCGGLVGKMGAGHMYECYATGNITGLANNAGGLIGSVTNYNSAAVSTIYVNDCYSAGSIEVTYTGTGGGLIGSITAGSVRRCYSIGQVSLPSGSTVGGLIATGSSSIQVENSFWDMDSSGQQHSFKGTGMTPVQVQDITTYLSAGWDFVNEEQNGTDDIWYMGAGQGPALARVEDKMAPKITAVADIPNDQGHQIRISWDRSIIDYIYAGNYYSVWRLVPASSRTASAPGLSDITTTTLQTNQRVIARQNDEYWEYLQTVPAMAFNDYAVVVQTSADSCAAVPASQYQYTCRVVYHQDGTTYSHQSKPVTGYSIDNIAPYPATNISALFTANRNQMLKISWDAVTQGGFNGNSYQELNGIWYKVYVGSAAGFECNSSNLVTITQNPYCEIDVTNMQRGFYKVVVSDQP